jgi:hypothetical protein
VALVILFWVSDTVEALFRVRDTRGRVHEQCKTFGGRAACFHALGVNNKGIGNSFQSAILSPNFATNTCWHERPLGGVDDESVGVGFCQF